MIAIPGQTAGKMHTLIYPHRGA